MKKGLLLPLVTLFTFFAHAQIDTEFWFAAPEVKGYTLNSQGVFTEGHSDWPIYLFISTYENPTQVTVDIPAASGVNTFSLTINIPADTIQRIDLTNHLDKLEHPLYNTVQQKAMHIVSDNPVSAYYEVLGTRHACDDDKYGMYLAGGGCVWDNDHAVNNKCWWPAPELAVIQGCEEGNDGTWDPVDYGDQINNTDIFALKGGNALGYDFFVNFQNEHRNVQYHNNSPTDSWGNSQTINAWSSFIVLATEDNTVIEITLPDNASATGFGAGSTWEVTLNRGETYAVRSQSQLGQFHMAGTRVKVKSGGKIAITSSDDSIAKYNTANNYDLAGDQLIPIDKAGTEFILEDGWAYLMATEDDTEIELDGTVVATIDAGETYSHDLTADVGTAHYFNTGEKPSLMLHINRVDEELGAAIIPPLGCTGSQLLRFIRSSDQENEQFFLKVLCREGIEGDFTIDGDANLLTAADFQSVGTSGYMYASKEYTNTLAALESHVIENTSGLFHLGLVNGKGRVFEGGNPNGRVLQNSTGSRYGYFSDFSEFEFELPPIGEICQVGSDIVIDADPADTLGTVTYTWIKVNIDGFSITFDTLQGTQADTAVITESGSYIVEAENELGCLVQDNFGITLSTIPTFEVEKDTFLCNGESIELAWPLGELTEYTSTSWYETANPDSTLSDSLLTVTQNGEYVFRADNNCGVNFDTVNVEFSTLSLDVGPDVVLCEDDSVITAMTDGDPNYEYLWSNGDQTQTTTLTVTGEYSVIVTDSQCVELDTMNILFTNLDLKSQLPNDTLICTPGESKDLNWLIDSTDLFFYSSWGWFLGENNRSDTLGFDTTITTRSDINQTMTYVFSASDRCKTVEDSFTVTFNYPNLELGELDSLCEDVNPELFNTANQNGLDYDYEWYSFDDENIRSTDSVYVVTTEDTLVVHITTPFGCQNYDTIAINYITTPIPNIEGETFEKCPEDDHIIAITNFLSEFEGFSYEWRQDGIKMDGEVDSLITVKTDAEYSFAVYYQDCPEKTDVFDLNNFTETVNIPEDTSCTDELLLNSNGNPALEFVWYFNDVVIDGATSETYLAEAEGEYKVEISGGVCTRSDSTNVVFIVIPDFPTDLGDTLTCTDDEITLNDPFENNADLDGFDFDWRGPGGYASTELNPSVDAMGTYTFRVSHPFGCTPNEGQFTISQIPLPVDLGGPYELCDGESQTLTSQVRDSLDHEWYNNSVLLDFTDSSITISESGTYEVIVKTGGCIRSDQAVVTFVEMPDLDTDLGSTSVCSDDTVDLPRPLTLSDLNDFNWSWYGPNGFETMVLDTFVTANGEYKFVVSHDRQCEPDTGIFTLEQITLSVDLDDSPVCYNEESYLIPGPSRDFDFLWILNGDTLEVTDSVYQITESGVYTVVVSQESCLRIDSADIHVIPEMIPMADQDTVLCRGDKDVAYTTQILLDSSEWTSYRWDLYDTTSMTLLEEIGQVDTLYLQEEGDYILTVTNGCEVKTDTISLRNWHIMIPNIFTPNEDGKNDEFIIEDIDLGGTWKLEVYNRWGRRVYRNDDYKNDWDAIDIKDEDQTNDGVYFFELSEDQHCNYFKGWVTIVR